MPIVLLRVDERLIHGQVVVAWGGRLAPDRYLVVDDLLAENDWEQELYLLSLPDDQSGDFVSVAEAPAALRRAAEASEKTVVLLRELAPLRTLADEGVLESRTVNLGGLHPGEGRREVLSYLHLSEADAALLADLAERGVRIQARDLPGARPTPVEELLR